MEIKESGENYLEAILMLAQQHESVRSVDVARLLGYSKPSISRAMSLLIERELISKDDSGAICLTSAGRTRAEQVLERHKIITLMLRKMGVSAETAETDACLIEHDVSDETFEKIKAFVGNEKDRG